MARYLRKLFADERIGQAGTMTIKVMQNYTPAVTNEILDNFDADFASLAAI